MQSHWLWAISAAKAGGTSTGLQLRPTGAVALEANRRTEEGGPRGGIQAGARAEAGRNPAQGRPRGTAGGLGRLAEPDGLGHQAPIRAGDRRPCVGTPAHWADRTSQRGPILPTGSCPDRASALDRHFECRRPPGRGVLPQSALPQDLLDDVRLVPLDDDDNLADPPLPTAGSDQR